LAPRGTVVSPLERKKKGRKGVEVVKTPVRLYNRSILQPEIVKSMERNEEGAEGGPLSPAEAGAGTSHPMDAYLEGEHYGMDMPRRGEVRTGTIARIAENDVLVDIGAKSEGVIPAREVERLSEEERTALTVGSQVTVYVISSGERDGNILLSLVRAEEEHDWLEAESLLKSQEVYEGTIAGYNKGGLIVKMGRLRGFIPASQVSLSRRRRAEGETPDKRWSKMVGEPIVAKIVEVDRRRNRLILSERAAAREAREALKERLIRELKPGEVRTGHVISLADFGAFVDIGGADGLVHLSEISWTRLNHPSEMLKVGQKVEVKVLGVDPERKRISLSMRELEADPWSKVAQRFAEGQLVEGKITKLTKFGAFASLMGEQDYEFEGLIHISELSDRRIEHPREVVKEGDVLRLRVIKVEPERRRIGLSLKRVDSAEYADVDWKAAMTEVAAPEPEAEEAEVVEDFDAALEEESSSVALPEDTDEGAPAQGDAPKAGEGGGGETGSGAE
jgi:small subunit ribosomal protein S1